MYYQLKQKSIFNIIYLSYRVLVGSFKLLDKTIWHCWSLTLQCYHFEGCNSRKINL